MEIRTRYRVLYNGVNYKIQKMIVIFSFFKKGNFKRVWKDLGSIDYDSWSVDYYQDKEKAIANIMLFKEADRRNSMIRKERWKKVYP